MKRYIIIAAFLLPGTLALLQGCKGKAPDDVSSEMKTESAREMIQLPGDWFTMGDEDEVPYPLSRQKLSVFKVDSSPCVKAVGTEGARRATGVLPK